MAQTCTLDLQSEYENGCSPVGSSDGCCSYSALAVPGICMVATKMDDGTMNDWQRNDNYAGTVHNALMM